MSDPDLLDHEYDGIREYDNPLPGWWKGVFVATIVFAPIYAWWFHFGGPGQTMHQELAAEYAAYEVHRAEAELTTRVVVTEALLESWAHDAGKLELGRAVFVRACVGCHQEDGRGNIGPNLTDVYQLHGATRLDLYTTIQHGVTGTAMIAWSESMSSRELAAVAAFVSTLRGHPVPEGKAPQGAKVSALP